MEAAPSVVVPMHMSQLRPAELKYKSTRLKISSAWYCIRYCNEHLPKCKLWSVVCCPLTCLQFTYLLYHLTEVLVYQLRINLLIKTELFKLCNTMRHLLRCTHCLLLLRARRSKTLLWCPKVLKLSSIVLNRFTVSLREWCLVSKCSFSFDGFMLSCASTSLHKKQFFSPPFVFKIRKSIPHVYSSLYLHFATFNICKQMLQVFFYGVKWWVSTLATGHYRHLLLRSTTEPQLFSFSIFFPRQRLVTHFWVMTHQLKNPDLDVTFNILSYSREYNDCVVQPAFDLETQSVLSRLIFWISFYRYWLKKIDR